MELLTAKQVVNKLRQGGAMDISEAYFSQRVRDGYIPFHRIPGKRRKMYIYDEAKAALLGSQDPTRDEQRAAAARLRKEADDKERMDYIQERYDKELDALTGAKAIANFDYREYLEADKTCWKHDTLEECYIEDMKIIAAADAVLDALKLYMETSKNALTANDIDLVVKEALVNSLYADDELSINWRAIIKGADQEAGE